MVVALQVAASSTIYLKENKRAENLNAKPCAYYVFVMMFTRQPDDGEGGSHSCLQKELSAIIRPFTISTIVCGAFYAHQRQDALDKVVDKGQALVCAMFLGPVN